MNTRTSAIPLKFLFDSCFDNIKCAVISIKYENEKMND